MQTMTWKEIDQDWSGLQKRHRMDIAQAVARYCVGHKIEEIAERLGQATSWVTARLDMAGMAAAVGHDPGSPGSWVEKHRGLQEDCGRLVSEFAPAVSIDLSDDGNRFLEHEKTRRHSGFPGFVMTAGLNLRKIKRNLRLDLAAKTTRRWPWIKVRPGKGATGLNQQKPAADQWKTGGG